MLSTRSSTHDSKPQSPNQEMSKTKVKDYGGVFDVLDSARKTNEVKLQGDNGNTKKADVEMAVAAEEDKTMVSGEVQNGENLPEKMDIETVEGDKDIVEPESIADNGAEGELVKPGGKTAGDEGLELDKAGDERLEDVKSEDADLVKSSENGCEESVDLSSGGAEPATPHAGLSDVKAEDKKGMDNEVNGKEVTTPMNNGKSSSKYKFLSGESYASDGNDSGTEEEQLDFVKEIEEFFKSRNLEYKPPKFYGDTVNCLKLYKIVMGLGGYDTVTTSKLWKQVGAYFKPPRTCTSLSYAFRGFYEKALLDYEKHEAQVGKFSTPIASRPNPTSVNTKASRPKPMTVDTKASQSKPKNVDTKAMDVDNQVSGTGRRRRESAARAMQGWHSQRLLANGEVSEPIIKDKNATSLQKQEKQHKTSGSQKRKKPPGLDPVTKVPRDNASTLRLDVDVSDLGTPADWVKVNVQKAKDCFEVYALIPGLLREEVRVQSDPAGRLVISGEPEQADNPWGVTPFKKAVILPSRIDPHGTSAVVTLHGQLFIRVPFEQSEE